MRGRGIRDDGRSSDRYRAPTLRGAAVVAGVVLLAAVAFVLVALSGITTGTPPAG
jgi:hypothetical protein